MVDLYGLVLEAKVSCKIKVPKIKLDKFQMIIDNIEDYDFICNHYEIIESQFLN